MKKSNTVVYLHCHKGRFKHFHLTVFPYGRYIIDGMLNVYSTTTGTVKKKLIKEILK
jgi:hypothetical protein